MTLVEYHEAAEEELLHEIGYLELRATGLGRRLFGDVRRAENLISRFPELAVEILPGIRKHVLRKFRYSLIYTMEQDRVLILALAHHSRRPAYWIGRVSQTRRENEGFG
ncbi:MAG: type II toxin-antitoxin system RelE/ParE family toxin [Acidobacteria bacterium]|nr:type II toxin-antitoxin system RelE/ParE family toxin [Acidobacteriota bacterium]